MVWEHDLFFFQRNGNHEPTKNASKTWDFLGSVGKFFRNRTLVSGEDLEKRFSCTPQRYFGGDDLYIILAGGISNRWLFNF